MTPEQEQQFIAEFVALQVKWGCDIGIYGSPNLLGGGDFETAARFDDGTTVWLDGASARRPEEVTHGD